MIRNKIDGYLTEAKVLTELLSRGFTVSRTEGDYSRYEMISDYMGKLNRIQIKSTVCGGGSTYKNGFRIVVAGGNKTKTRYTKNDCDFIICCVVPKEAYYIIPVEEIKSLKISLYPHYTPKGKKPVGKIRYEDFLNKWDLLK